MAARASSAALEFRRLFPDPGALGIGELIASLTPTELAPDERPYTIVNFVVSVDGRAAFHGRSGTLGDDGDKAMFHGLRERVDAVLAGTGTLRTERYGRLVRDPERRKRREQSGLRPEPLASTITRSGDVPTDIPLFSDANSTIVVFTSGELDVSGLEATVEVEHVDPGELTATTMVRRLRSEHGVRALLCEGGPIMFGALLKEQLVDELFLTVAPKLTGGGHPLAITMGPELQELQQLELVWALERNDSLYLRYRIG